MQNNAFPAIANISKIYVPKGKGDAYKAASNWSSFASVIFELDEDGNIPT